MLLNSDMCNEVTFFMYRTNFVSLGFDAVSIVTVIFLNNVQRCLTVFQYLPRAEVAVVVQYPLVYVAENKLPFPRAEDGHCNQPCKETKETCGNVLLTHTHAHTTKV